MLSIFSGRFAGNGTLTGIDAGHNAIRVVSLVQRRKGFLVKSTIEFRDEHGFSAVDGKGFENLVFALRETRQGERKGKKVVLAVEQKNIFLEHLFLPLIPRRETEKAIRWEAERRIPAFSDDFILSSVYLGKKNVNGIPQAGFLLAAVPRPVIHAYCEAFACAGLAVAAIDLQALALWRAFHGAAASMPVQGTLGVINLEEKESLLILINKRELLYTRKLASLGAQCEFFSLRAEVTRAISNYFFPGEDFFLEKLLLTGETDRLEGQVGLTEKEVWAKVEVGRPLLPAPGKEECLNSPGPSFAVATGLALREARVKK